MLLTRLFEHMALLIDRHQTLVDRFYGPGSFAHGVMTGLQDECDRLGSKILRTWKEERKLKRKVCVFRHDQVHTGNPDLTIDRTHTQLDASRLYRPTFLDSIGSGASGRLGYSSPARPGTPAGGASAGRNAAGAASVGGALEEDGAERREVDQVLAEAAAIGATWATYRRFLQGRLSDDSKAPQSAAAAHPTGDGQADGADGEDGMRDFRRHSLSRPSLDGATTAPGWPQESGLATPAALPAPPIAETSQIGKEVKEILHEEYVLLETWHLRSSLERVSLTEAQPSVLFLSSLVDAHTHTPTPPVYRHTRSTRRT